LEQTFALWLANLTAFIFVREAAALGEIMDLPQLAWIIETIRTRPLEAIVIALATIFVFTVWIAVGIPLARCVWQGPMVRLHPPGTKRWRIMISSHVQYVGHVYAKDEAEAIDEAVKGFKIGSALRNRIVAMRDD
jgi:hypothetical protein